MHALEENAQKIVQRYSEGVRPLPGKVCGEGRIGIRCWKEREREPFFPLSLVLQLRRLFLEEVLCLVYPTALQCNHSTEIVIAFFFFRIDI